MAKVAADVTNTEWIFGKAKNDAHLTNFLLLTNNFRKRPAVQGFGGQRSASQLLLSPGLRLLDEDPPCSFPGCHIKDNREQPAVRGSLGAGLVQAETQRAWQGLLAGEQKEDVKWKATETLGDPPNGGTTVK